MKKHQFDLVWKTSPKSSLLLSLLFLLDSFLQDRWLKDFLLESEWQ